MTATPSSPDFRSGRAAPQDWRRINVVGSSATGKSVFSARLAEALGVPHLEMDALFWGPGWQQPSDEVFFARLESSLEGDAWVLDGNFSKTAPIKWRRAQAVVWLDFPFALTAARAIRRAFRRAWSREELWPGTGNRESFRKSFLSRDSIILWSVKNHGKIRERYAQAMKDPRHAHLGCVRLRTPAAADEFLRRVRATARRAAVPSPVPLSSAS